MGEVSPPPCCLCCQSPPNHALCLRCPISAGMEETISIPCHGEASPKRVPPEYCTASLRLPDRGEPTPAVLPSLPLPLDRFFAVFSYHLGMARAVCMPGTTPLPSDRYFRLYSLELSFEWTADDRSAPGPPPLARASLCCLRFMHGVPFAALLPMPRCPGPRRARRARRLPLHHSLYRLLCFRSLVAGLCYRTIVGDLDPLSPFRPVDQSRLPCLAR